MKHRTWAPMTARERAAGAAAPPTGTALQGEATAAAAPPAGDVRISVVVPTCGRPELLMRGLQALAAQTLPRKAYEIVVVDDGRCDWTRTLVQALAQQEAGLNLRYLRPPLARGGPAAARNLGWHAARGELVAFTDDDTVPAADWLAHGEAAMQAAPQAAALAGRVVVPRGAGAPTDHERMTQGLERTAFVTANAFVRRCALQQVQGFDERFTRPWREDSDLQWRLQAEAGTVGRCEEAVVVHPVRPERWGLSLRQQKNAFFEALLYAKHPRRYAAEVGGPPWHYHATVVLTAAALVLWGLGIGGSAVVCAVLALALVLRFAARRLRGSSHTPAHVAEMLLTSALIPFLSVGWRLRGALHFRVPFL